MLLTDRSEGGQIAMAGTGRKPVPAREVKMKNILLLPAAPKRILLVGNIKKYVVAGEQKSTLKIVPADRDKDSQEYARKVFNGMFSRFVSGR